MMVIVLNPLLNTNQQQETTSARRNKYEKQRTLLG